MSIPHSNFSSFPNIQGFIHGYVDNDGNDVDGIVAKIGKFKESTGAYPKTVAIDTVSRVFQIIADNASRQLKGYDVHSNISKEIAQFNRFLEEDLVLNGMNVVSLTHVVLNSDTGSYEDASSGAYKKSGGSISTHDNVSFLQVKAKKYIITHKSPGLPCRTLLDTKELPDTQSADEYSLAAHIKLLEEANSHVDTFII